MMKLYLKMYKKQEPYISNLVKKIKIKLLHQLHVKLVKILLKENIQLYQMDKIFQFNQEII